jgi:hypothetical protein
MIQQLNSVDQYCCLFHIVHPHTQVLLSKEATVPIVRGRGRFSAWARGEPAAGGWWAGGGGGSQQARPPSWLLLGLGQP